MSRPAQLSLNANGSRASVQASAPDEQHALTGQIATWTYIVPYGSNGPLPVPNFGTMEWTDAYIIEVGDNSRIPSSQADTTTAPARGTTWAQKQAALSTASQFQRDPSKVNSADAHAAFSTANNFRQRHGEEVAHVSEQIMSEPR